MIYEKYKMMRAKKFEIIIQIFFSNLNLLIKFNL